VHQVSAAGAEHHQLLEHDLVDVATVSAIYTQGAAGARETTCRRFSATSTWSA
jgi:hypothetical protein